MSIYGSQVAQLVKNLPAVQETLVRFLGEKFPGEGIGCPLQYSCLENPMDRGAWQAPWGHKELDTTEGLTLHFTWPMEGL